MANTNISTAVAQAAIQQIQVALDGGPGAGYIEIRTGSQPASVDDVATGTLLATLTLNDPSFPAAVDAGGSATITANAITGDTNADAAGTASWFRAYDSTGTAVIDGDVGTTVSEDLQLNNVNIGLNDTVNITSWVITLPE